MAEPKPVALYPGAKEIVQFDFAEYPSIAEFLDAGDQWWAHQWKLGKEFLANIAKHKPVHTFNRFRSEVEKLILWSFLKSGTPVTKLKKYDILDFVTFTNEPPPEWVRIASGDKRHSGHRFRFESGVYVHDEKWAPFTWRERKNASIDDPLANSTTEDKSADRAKKLTYSRSQESLKSTFTAISSFYEYLVEEEEALANPSRAAKKECQLFVDNRALREDRRLKADQWDYLYRTALKMANNDPVYERNLFALTACKVLFLRIGELSDRPSWKPTMGHFSCDDDGNWWLRVLGKRSTVRKVSVPEAFLPALARYRKWLGCSTALPSPDEREPLLGKIRGSGGMTTRHISRLLQEVFDEAYKAMQSESGEAAARELKLASAHWLRHTGASMEIERGRALKDLAEDLGHKSTHTTDALYVHIEDKIRAASGKDRSI